MARRKIDKPPVVIPPNAIVLSNGTIKDPVTGHFLTGGPKTQITKENAPALARRQQELYRQRWAAGAMKETGAATKMGALEIIAASVTQQALERDGLASVKAAELVARGAGWLADRGSGSSQDRNSVTIDLTNDAIERILGMIGNK